MVFVKRIETVTYQKKPTKVIIYSSTDAVDMVESLKEMRNKQNYRVEDYDIFSKCSFDAKWAGVKDKDHALNMIRHGTENTKLVESVKSYIEEVNGGVKVRKYREIDYRPFGCTPCIPRVLSGNPNCMILPKKSPVRSRIIKILVDCAVSWYFSPEDIRRVGSTIARAICDIEQAGYRVRLYAAHVTHNRDDPSEILCTHLMMKGENEPVNLKRMLYPLAEVSFLRILGFTVINRAEEWKKSNELYPILEDSDSKEKKELYETINGPDTIVLRLQKLGNELRTGDKEDVKKLVKEIFASNDELIQGGS